jgi:hypothetical protein
MAAQTYMPLFMGLAPGLNSSSQIDSMQYTNKFVSKAASYTCKVEESGTIFDTTGASGAITFTLPAVASSAGVNYTFVNLVDQNMLVTAPSGTMVTDGNAGATTITFSTTSHKIGASVMVFCNGAKWFLLPGSTLLAVYTVS